MNERYDTYYQPWESEPSRYAAMEPRLQNAADRKEKLKTCPRVRQCPTSVDSSLSFGSGDRDETGEDSGEYSADDSPKAPRGLPLATLLTRKLADLIGLGAAGSKRLARAGSKRITGGAVRLGKAIGSGGLVLAKAIGSGGLVLAKAIGFGGLVLAKAIGSGGLVLAKAIGSGGLVLAKAIGSGGLVLAKAIGSGGLVLAKAIRSGGLVLAKAIGSGGLVLAKAIRSGGLVLAKAIRSGGLVLAKAIKSGGLVLAKAIRSGGSASVSVMGSLIGLVAVGAGRFWCKSKRQGAVLVRMVAAGVARASVIVFDGARRLVRAGGKAGIRLGTYIQARIKSAVENRAEARAKTETGKAKPVKILSNYDSAIMPRKKSVEKDTETAFPLFHDGLTVKAHPYDHQKLSSVSSSVPLFESTFESTNVSPDELAKHRDMPYAVPPSVLSGRIKDFGRIKDKAAPIAAAVSATAGGTEKAAERKSESALRAEGQAAREKTSEKVQTRQGRWSAITGSTGSMGWIVAAGAALGLSFWAGLVSAGTSALGAGFVAVGKPGETLNKNEIEMTNYLLEHPEFFFEIVEKYEAKQIAIKLDAIRPTLEKPFSGAWGGNVRGDVTLVIFTDYACGHCRVSVANVDRLLREDKGVKLVYRELPLLDPQSRAAAIAALKAARQRKYDRFHHEMFASDTLSDTAIAAALARAGVVSDGSADATINEDVLEREIDNNRAMAWQLGLSGTPSFVVGSRILEGAVGYEALARAVAEERRSKQEAEAQPNKLANKLANRRWAIGESGGSG